MSFIIQATDPQRPPKDVAAHFETEREANAASIAVFDANPGALCYPINTGDHWIVQVWFRSDYAGVIAHAKRCPGCAGPARMFPSPSTNLCAKCLLGGS